LLPVNPQISIYNLSTWVETCCCNTHQQTHQINKAFVIPFPHL